MPEERRTALVTGGAARVGRAIVERLAGAGFAVAFTYFQNQAEAEQLSARLSGSLAIRADLSDVPTGADHVAAAVQRKFGRLDLLVNNASIYQEGSLASADVQQWRKMSALHIESPLRLVQQFCGELRRCHGHIVNMLDLQAERPWPKYMVYCATKAALWNLTLSWARELAPQVTVNGIAPGVVIWPAKMPEEEKRKYLEHVPLARAGTPGDVAELVYFLATGGSYITGQIIRLDGGRSLV